MKKLPIISTIIAALALQACATGQDYNSAGNQKAINTAVGALAGAATGALISKTTGGSHTGRDAAIGAAVGALGGYVWTNRMEQQRVAMQTATAGTGITVERTADNQLKLDIPADAGFAVNDASIQPRLQGVLNTLASTLNTNSTTMVRIVGHTDSSGSDSVNFPLSQRRAASTRDYLANRSVINSRMTTEGVGSTQPIASNATESGKAMNRRVEVYVAQSAQTAMN